MNAASSVMTAVLVGAIATAVRGDFELREAVAGAAPGAVVRVPAGTHAGPVVIERPLTLIAEGKAVIDGGGEGDVVTIKAPDVTVRGFVIRNTGISLDRENAGITVLAPRVTLERNVLEDVLFGIYLKGAEQSVIRGNRIGGKDLDVARRGDGIRLWQSAGTLIEDNIVDRSRDVVMWFSNDVRLRRNRVTNGRYGLHFMYSHGNVLEDNHLEGNSVGAFLMYSSNLTLRRNVFARNRGPSGYGVGLKDLDGVTATDNAFAGNRIGVYLDNSPSSVDIVDDFHRNVFAYNDIGIAFQPSVERNRFRNNAFLENLEQVAVLGGGTFEGNEFTVEGVGNFWSDYRGYDLDGDGVGDLTYRAEGLFENLMDREPKLRLFLFSPAQQALDLAARAFPVVQPTPKLTDAAPLMHPVKIDGVLPGGGSRAGMFGLASALMAGAVAVLVLGGFSWNREDSAQAQPGPGAVT